MPAPAAPDVPAILARLVRPSRMVVTAGMPYANGPLHLGHLAGAHVPADIFARWARMLVGPENVLYVCGTDDHGSTSELAAAKAGVPVAEFLAGIHATQRQTLARYGISLDTYSGTSRPECFLRQTAICQDILARLHANGMLSKRTTRQWFDPVANRFLPDRLVRGTCPNPKCNATDAYSDECERCGHQHDPSQLIDPRSALSDATPVMRETAHWWLDLWRVSETLRAWLQAKARQKAWRPSVLADVLDKVMPSLTFANVHEDAYKALKAGLPAHRSKYTAGKQVLLQFADKPALEAARTALSAAGIATALYDGWAHRSISRDTAWGVPLPPIDPDLAGKTLYVWPDSLIAPIAFTQVALAQSGRDPERWREFWTDPAARVVQFLGQDNVYFYVLMQGGLWLGSQADPQRLPVAGELQLTDIVGNCHLMVGGEKMSKSRGNFYTGDQLLEQHDPDQVRYFLALLSLAEKSADFDLAKFAERNAFLAGPMNAAFEKPISACHARFGGRVPDGRLIDKVAADTARIVARYVKSMERADYPNLLFEIENYARTVNSLFTQYKPHDDRFDEAGRRDALFTCFYVLKNLMLMLHPFVPATMERLRTALNLPADVYRVDQLGTGLPVGHPIGAKPVFFPAVEERAAG